MPFWPVAAREARSAARSPRMYAWRAAVCATTIALVPLAMSIGAAQPGRSVFEMISLIGFIYSIFGGVLRTADAIAEEKRENTLGLLFLTDLKAADVILGKLLASAANLFFGVLSLMPLLALPIIMGGVTSRQIVLMALCFVNSLFFAVSVGFLISTLLRQGWMTISVGLATMLGFCGIVPVFAQSLGGDLSGFIAPLSPLLMFSAVVDNAPQQLFWQGFIVTHLLAWLNIFYTAKWLPALWQERPRSVRAQQWFERLHKVRFGGERARNRFRTRLLNRNPLFWLSGREQVSSAGLMGLLMCVAAVSLITGWREVLGGLGIMHLALLMRIASAASHIFAEDRKSGALELLLATSLTIRDVLKGRWMALGRQFFGPILIVGIWHGFTILWVAVMSNGLDVTLVLFSAMPAIFLAWVACGWCGMWMGLRARHPIAAIWGTLGTVIVGPWILLGGAFSLLSFLAMLPEFPFNSKLPFLTIGFLIWAFYLFAVSAWSARRVKKNFREAATDRYTDTQPIDWRPVWRLTWRIAGTAAAIFIVILSARAWINYSGARELQSALAAHSEFQPEMTSRYVPDSQNLATLQTFRAINHPNSARMAMHNATDPKLSDVWATPIPAVKPLQNWRIGKIEPFDSTNRMWIQDQKKYNDQMARLHEAARERPFCVFDLKNDYAVANYSWPIVNWVSFLAWRAEVRLSAGERPVDDILLALRLANSLTNYPTGLDNRSTAILSLIQPIYHGIHDGRWSDDDLKALQAAFQNSDDFVSYEVFRSFVVATMMKAVVDPPTATTPSPYGNIVPFWWGPRAHTDSRLPGTLDARKAELIRFAFEKFAPAVDRTNGIVRNVSPELLRQRSDSFQSDLLAMMHHHFDGAMRKTAITRTATELVITACAIERYRLANHKLPDNLRALTPNFLKAVPNDVVTGEPLNYHSGTEAYKLYSIGLDGYDDNGVPEVHDPKFAKNNRRGDWVWIYNPLE